MRLQVVRGPLPLESRCPHGPVGDNALRQVLPRSSVSNWPGPPIPWGAKREMKMQR
jgi:hypothetical protein